MSRKQKRVPKVIRDLGKLSDEEILELEKKLQLKAAGITGSGFLLFVVCIVLIVILF